MNCEHVIEKRCSCFMPPRVMSHEALLSCIIFNSSEVGYYCCKCIFNSRSASVPIICRAPSFFVGSRCSGGNWRIWTQNVMVGSRTCFLFHTAVWTRVDAATTGDTKSSKISGWGAFHLNQSVRLGIELYRFRLLDHETRFQVEVGLDKQNNLQSCAK